MRAMGTDFRTAPARCARLAALAALIGLAACTGHTGKTPGQEAGPTIAERLGNSARTNRPDEFLVLPKRPLEMPEDLASLPQPTPGQGNRTDLTPIADSRVALGGSPAGGSVGAGDAALVASASRYGVAPNIRATLASEDEVWRSENRGRLLERLFRQNDQSVVYRRVILDPYPELLRLRGLGLRTPAAPPPQ